MDGNLYRKRKQHFEDLLVAEQAKRSSRTGMVELEGSKYKVPAWHAAEMLMLHAAVTGFRDVEGLPFVTLGDFLKVMQMAEGHFDYTHKLAIYATDLTNNADPKSVRP